MSDCDSTGWEECTECMGLGPQGLDGVMMGRVYEPGPRESIREERGSYYGDPTINHASIGAIWAGILLQALSSGRWKVGETLPPDLVCLMMVGVKLSREAYRHKDDNIVDAKVYIDFVDEMSRG